jgi:hypothetical protein|tara:strand:+ start:4395 stop:5111 length:717 start_codon:yes stop_codon:yes gene_type:complete
MLEAEDLRVGLLGPSRESPHWQFFKRGLAEASAESRLAWIVDEVPVYTVERPLPPGESVGHVEVDRVALSSAIHIMAVDLSPRKSGTLLYFETTGGNSGDTFTRPWMDVLEAHPIWPSTGAWSWAEANTPGLVRHRLASVVTPELRLVRQSGGFPSVSRNLPKVALAMDSFALSSLADGRADVLVVPHFAEAGRWVIDQLLRVEKVNPSSTPVFQVSPLLVTKNNVSTWVEWWKLWER